MAKSFILLIKIGQFLLSIYTSTYLYITQPNLFSLFRRFPSLFNQLSKAAVSFSSMETTLHLAFYSSPGVSHLIPFVEFAKRFFHLHHDFHVTLIARTLESQLKATNDVLATLPPGIDSVVLPVNLQDLPQSQWMGTRLMHAVKLSLSSLREILKPIMAKAKLVALLFDPFSVDVLDVAKEFNIPPYLYYPTEATALSSLLHMSKLDETLSRDLVDIQETITMPGCVPLHGSDFPDPVLRRSTESYREYISIGDRIRFVDGVVLNTFLDIDEGPIKALRNEAGIPPIYPVGPVIQRGSSVRQEDLECLRWLDSQPHRSVLFVSFGSGGTLSHEQLIELANGLELSGQKFIWVVRPPSQVAHGAYLGALNENPLSFLPSGFLDKTEGKGFVIPSWAPQIEILSHESTAGFLSHCGWSSTLESIVHGVPIIAWPLFAEQRMNAVLLIESLKVALRPRVNDNGFVDSAEIAKVIKNLMYGLEGKRIRERMNAQMDAAANVLRADGTSTLALNELAMKWKKL